MACWSQLPPELVDGIIIYISNSLHLKSTSLVCSQLRDVSRKLLFKSVVVGRKYSSHEYDDTEKPVYIGPDPEAHERLLRAVEPVSDEDAGLQPTGIQQMLAFLNLMNHRQRLRGIESLKLGEFTHHIGDRWLDPYSWKLEGDKICSSEDFDAARSTDWYAHLRPPLTEVIDSLVPHAKSVGVNEALVRNTPLSASLLITLHVLPIVQRLYVVDADQCLPTLILAARGELSGGVPICLRDLPFLQLGSADGFGWLYSPIAFICSLPALQTLRTHHWGGGVTTDFSSFMVKVPAKVAAPYNDGAVISPRLQSVTFSERMMDIKDVTDVLATATNLEHFEYNPVICGYFYDFNLSPPSFDCLAFSQGLAAHCRSLRSLTIRWDVKDLEVEVNFNLLASCGTLSELHRFTSLTHLTIPAPMLLGEAYDFVNLDPRPTLSSLLPHNLQSITSILKSSWKLTTLNETFQLTETWPSVRSEVLPRLESSILEHEEYEPSEEHLRLRDGLVKIGITSLESLPHREVD